MFAPRDLAYSLFGGPLILNVGPTVNGEIIRVRVQPINTFSVAALIISIALFVCFMYFYLYPLFRQRATRRRGDAEKSQADEEEKTNLLSWLHFRSRDRFSSLATDDTAAEPIPSTPTLKRKPSTFARDSLVPHLSPTLPPPPPAYASRPNSPFGSRSNSPLSGSRVPSPLGSSRSAGPSSPQSPSLSSPNPVLTTTRAPAFDRLSPTSRAQFHPRHSEPNSRSLTAQFSPQNLTRSGTVPPRTTVAVRAFVAPRSVSAHTLHPEAADVPIPSRAKVYAAEGTQGSGDGRMQDGSGLGIGGAIGLAERGRVLKRGHSNSGMEGVGARF
ncbi:hypothetical protein R3P38DRAFT_782338 [Favolaschia claudopus]|uniref:Proteophosphoglycan ppg4 n=1 Tax=Favolaschia claudopus TaxID=2862362 RepID=A0AAW0C2J7_9AGAR